MSNVNKVKNKTNTTGTKTEVPVDPMKSEYRYRYWSVVLRCKRYGDTTYRVTAPNTTQACVLAVKTANKLTPAVWFPWSAKELPE